MTFDANLEAAGSAPRPATTARIAWLASVVFCGVLPALVIIALFVTTMKDGSMAVDLRQFYRGAEAILRGDNLYPPADYPLTASARPYVYPPLPAILAMPLTVLPLEVAELLVMSAQVVGVLAILFVLGVRDWRCFGVVFLWPPVLSAIQTSNFTLLFALVAALAWRYRDRRLRVSASLGVTLAIKFVLWPLVGWLAVTRRLTSAALSVAVGSVILLLSWAAIGFAGLTGYPDLVRRLEDTVGKDAYTTYIVALDLGASPGVARAIWLTLGVGLLAAVVVVGRRGDERSAFILAIAAAIALSPLVWLHYFALLLIPVALARPRFGLVWLVPLAMFVSPGRGNPTLFETATALAAAALTVFLALRASVEGVRPVGSDPSPAVTRAQARTA